MLRARPQLRRQTSQPWATTLQLYVLRHSELLRPIDRSLSAIGDASALRIKGAKTVLFPVWPAALVPATQEAARAEVEAFVLSDAPSFRGSHIAGEARPLGLQVGPAASAESRWSVPAQKLMARARELAGAGIDPSIAAKS